MQILRRVRSRQPQAYTLPDRGPVNYALQALCLPYTFFNSANGSRGTVSSNPAPRAPGLYGTALKYTRGAGNQKAGHTVAGSSGGITLLWVGSITGFGANTQKAVTVLTSAGGTTRIFIGENSNSKTTLVVTPSGGGTVTVAEATGTTADAVWIGRVDAAGGVTFYRNGALVGSATAASANFSDVTVVEVGSTTFVNDANCLNYLTALWNRPITDAEVTSLSANPWQAFAEVAATPLVEVASGGGTTYNVSVAESTSLSDALTGIATFSSAGSESITLADTPASSAILSASVTESTSLSDTGAGAWSTPAALAEAMSLADDTDATTGPNVYDVSTTEAISLADTQTGEFPFQAPQFSGADAWPRKRDTLREDVLDAIEKLAPSKKIEREAKQAFKRTADAPQAPSIGVALAQAITGASERVQALVERAIVQAQAQQRSARRRKQQQQQQLLLM